MAIDVVPIVCCLFLKVTVQFFRFQSSREDSDNDVSSVRLIGRHMDHNATVLLCNKQREVVAGSKSVDYSLNVLRSPFGFLLSQNRHGFARNCISQASCSWFHPFDHLQCHTFYIGCRFLRQHTRQQNMMQQCILFIQIWIRIQIILVDWIVCHFAPKKYAVEVLKSAFDGKNQQMVSTLQRMQTEMVLVSYCKVLWKKVLIFNRKLLKWLIFNGI